MFYLLLQVSGEVEEKNKLYTDGKGDQNLNGYPGYPNVVEKKVMVQEKDLEYCIKRTYSNVRKSECEKFQVNSKIFIQLRCRFRCNYILFCLTMFS